MSASLIREMSGWLIVIALFTTAGCATPGVWYKADAVPGDFDRDAAQCRYEAQIYTRPANLGPARNMNDAIVKGLAEGFIEAGRQISLYNACMEARGWRLVNTQTAELLKQPPTQRIGPAAPIAPTPPRERGAPDSDTSPPPPKLGLVEQLDDLDRARDAGKITKAEHKSLRTKILNEELTSSEPPQTKAPKLVKYEDQIRSKGSIHDKILTAAGLCNTGKITKEERNKLQEAILRGEL